MLRRLLLCILAIALFAGCVTSGIRPKRTGEEITALDLVLEHLYLERHNLSITREMPPSPFLLNKVSHFLTSPIQLIAFAEQVDRALDKKDHDLSSLVAFCSNMLELQLETTAFTDVVVPDGIDAIEDTRLKSIVADLYTALFLAQALLEEAFINLDDREIRLVQLEIDDLLFYGKQRGNLTRKESQNMTEKAFKLAARIDLQKIAQACYLVASVLDRTVPQLKKKGLYRHQQVRITTPLGLIVIGDTADDCYEGVMPLLLIEPGGNDTYRFGDHVRLSIVIDLCGDDVYDAAKSWFPGAGLLGLGFLIDIAGDDVYTGNKYCLGSGVLGAGVLADLQGNDTYTAGMFCQGAATFGIGLLFDKEGNDSYRSALYGQGMGYVGGIGLLADIEGDDNFISGNLLRDEREKEGAFQTYSQGFGLGCRNFASGGVGVLYNKQGDDTYKGSYFCQGSSYWQALGLLIDGRGNDCYSARRYSQGAGIHFSVGMLVDENGNDEYTSWGVSQGCGHDHSVGLLHDHSGDDLYKAEWLSQGGGSSTGIGLFIEDKGNDTYKIQQRTSVQGSGSYDKRRDTVSVGIFIDGEGEDTGLRTKGLWTQGDIGGAINSDDRLSSFWYEPLKSNCFQHYELGYDNSSSKADENWQQWILPELEEPLFGEESWENASAALAAQGPHIIPALLQYLEIKDVSLHRTIEETFKKLGEYCLEDIHRYLKKDVRTAREKKFLLYVLGDMSHAESQEVFLDFLSDNSSALQAMALRGFYKLQEPVPLEMAEMFFESTSSTVKRFLCLALQYADGDVSLQMLTKLLTDSAMQVRQAAYRVLQEKTMGARPFLKELKAQSGLLPSVYRMIDDLTGY